MKTKTASALVAMSIGGMLYILSRSTTLVMFRWFRFIGIINGIQALRSSAHPYLDLLPNWVYFSLPEGLWYLSGLLAFEAIWGSEARLRRQRRAWLILFSLLAVGSELGQLPGWVPGRFDFMDLAALLAAWVVFASIGLIESYRRAQERSSEGESRCLGT
jgi:hypothetical protein